MPDLSIDTTSANYSARRQQFAEIVQYYKPRIKQYRLIRDKDQKAAWRAADPFLDDLLRFVEKVKAGGKEL